MTIARGDFKALSSQTDGAVGAALRARDFDTKSGAQDGTGWTTTAHVRAGKIAFQRRRVDFRMARAVVLLLDPGLRRLIEQIKREAFFSFEHRHQPSLDRKSTRLNSSH